MIRVRVTVVFYLSWAHVSGWPIRLICRAKMPIVVSLGLRTIKAHLKSRRRFTPYHAFIHADGYTLEKEREVTTCSNFEISHFSSLILSFVSRICSFTLFDGYLCDSSHRTPFKMVGTRSGINTTIPLEKEKFTMNRKMS